MIPGGTGPFDRPLASSSLGNGVIQESAAVTPEFVTGTLTFAFHHVFDDALRVGRASR